MNRKAIGLIGFLLAVLLLVAFIGGIAYVAFVLIYGGTPAPEGTISVESTYLVKATQAILAVTIMNNGPRNIVSVTLNITTESYTFDLSSNPLLAHIQRGFSHFLTGYYEWAKTYPVTIYVKFSSGADYQTTVSAVCK
jgi:cell division septal protein FtsQ